MASQNRVEVRNGVFAIKIGKRLVQVFLCPGERTAYGRL